jgi:hypothetical protein
LFEGRIHKEKLNQVGKKSYLKQDVDAVTVYICEVKSG